MKARLPLASLFATTSVAALLATTSGAFAAGTTVSSPTTNVVVSSNTDFISIETTISNTAGLDGLVVSGATIGYNGYPDNISNSDSGGGINVTDADPDEDYDGTLNGILVTDEADVYDGISNGGPISVDGETYAFVDGGSYRDAAGIRVNQDSMVGSIYSSANINASARVSNVATGDDVGTGEQSINSGAFAFGVDFTGQGSSFYNSGGINATSQSRSSAQTSYDLDAYEVDVDESGSNPGETFSTAAAYDIAAGVNFVYDGSSVGYIASSVQNNEGDTIVANARATGTSTASINVECTVSSEESCTTPGSSHADALSDVTVHSYGVSVTGSTAKAGEFYNAGDITANGTAYMYSNASAQSDQNEAASAYAGARRTYYDDDYYYTDPSTINQDVIGVRYDTLRVDDVENVGNITANAQATAYSFAMATAYDVAEADVGASVSQTAKGIEISAMLVNGGIENSGRVEANASTVIGDAYMEDDDLYYVPSLAHAEGAYEADANNYATVYSGATGIEVNATSVTDDFHLYAGNSEEESGNGIFATANLYSAMSAEATASAEGDISESAYAEATVGPNVNVGAVGVDFAVGNLSGQFINEGQIDATTNLDLTQSAAVHTYGEGDAEAYAYVNGSAKGIEVTSIDEGGSTISGNFYNEGEISADVNIDNQSNAMAGGFGDLNAMAGVAMVGSAQALDLYIGELQDNFRNFGNLSATSDVSNTLRAASASERNNEESDPTFADASAYAGGGEEESSYTDAVATGLALHAGTIGGFIETDSNVLAQATAHEDNWADAYAGNDGDAYAYAVSNLAANGIGIDITVQSVGTSLEYVDDIQEPDGFVVNESEINTRMTASSLVKATADADEGNATAYAISNNFDGSEDGPYGSVYAAGYSLVAEDSSGEIGGSILNFGNIYVEGDLNATLSALAHTHEGDEDSVAAALAGGAYSSRGQGYVIDGMDIEADNSSEEGPGFYNDGYIGVDLTNETEINAEATSDDGSAVAMIGRYIYNDGPMYYYSEGTNINHADGTGLAISDTYIDGDFVNSGMIGISATAFSDLYAKAKADEDSEAQASIIDNVSSDVYGIRADGLELDGTFTNSGVVYAFAGAGASSTAYAVGDTATAQIGYDERANEARANSTGIEIEAYGDMTFVNAYDGEDAITGPYDSEEGMIVAWATAGSSAYAHAVGSDEATAEVNQSDSAYALGVDLYMSESGAFDFTNQGGIFAFAGVGVYEEDEERHEAYADASSYASADVRYEAQANATGAYVQFSNFSNSGIIAASAMAKGDAYAHANADGGTASVNADVTVYATAVGAYLEGRDGEGSFTNSGTISAAASAIATARASIGESDEYDDYSAYAFASASAVGVEFTNDSYFDSFTNSSTGVISAQANATASEKLGSEDATSGSSYAYAWGVYLGSGTTFNTFENDGEISASATATQNAEAYGLELRDTGNYSFSGSIVNKGTISAHATAEDPYAVGILISDDSAVSSISNSGTISATVDDTSEIEPFSEDASPAIAIDIRGAGTPMVINQLAGSIVGDVHMENGNIDTFNWSGGTISGDIYGDYENDYMNVYSSVVGETTYNDFTYNDVIDGLSSFSVNGGDNTDTVALRINNQVRNVAAFNVGPNATVTLGSSATVQTDALNLDSAATLAFDVTTDGANGVINTGTADLNGARVRANFVDPILPDAGTYRIINWDDKSDTEFASVVSNSVLEKVRAEYGDDGVDLLVERLKFVQVAGLGDDALSLSKALDKIFGDIDPDSDIGQAIRLLVQLTPDQYAYELEQIAGQQTADLQHVTTTQLGSLIHVIQTQINEARTLTGPTGGDGASISFGNKQMSFSSGDDTAPMTGAAAGDPVMKGDWKAWARVFGDWSKLDASNTAAGYKSDSGGAVVGIDYAVSDGLTFGLAGGYQSSSLDFGGTGDGDIKSWSVTAYGDYEFGNAYVDGLVGYSSQSYDMNRYLNILGTPYTANSQYDGSSLIGAIEAGYKFAVAGNATLTPFIGLNGTDTDTDSFAETGAGIWNLTYEDRSDSQIDSVVGARISRDYKMDDGMKLTPTFELGWKHGFGDQSPTANAALSSVPGSQFQIFGSETAADSAIVGAALQVQMTDAVDAYVQYNGQYSSDFTENTASLRLRVKF